MKKSIELIPVYEADSSWWQHVPIAHWLVENLQPKLIVELGTHYGVSFFSFCEAANEYSPSTFIYAIDTWKGDEHAGFYEEDIYEVVSNHQEKYHKLRSRLVRSSFDEAAEKFQNEIIDILHIDGLHTYEAVRHDFRIWLPKVKEGGTIIFHDWNVREKDFGVWKLWAEIKEMTGCKCIEIPNGHGLGIATKTMEKPVCTMNMKDLPELKTKGVLLDRINSYSNRISLLVSKSEVQEARIKNLEVELVKQREHSKELCKIIEYKNKSVVERLIKQY